MAALGQGRGSSPPSGRMPSTELPVEACASRGTHYADLTGEVLFIRHSIDRFDQSARETGPIVHACGYDSIPSDIGVLLLHEQAQVDGAGDLERRPSSPG